MIDPHPARKARRRDRVRSLLAPGGGAVLLALPLLAGIGARDSMLGVAWVFVQRDYSQPLSAVGVLLAASLVGYLLGSQVPARLTPRIGTGRLMGISSALMAIGLLAFGLASSWPVLVAGYGLVGVSVGLIDVGVNTYAATHHGVGTMNLLHAGYGLGTVGGPLLVTAVILGGGSWRLSYVALAAIECALFALLSWRRRTWRDSATRASPVIEHRTQPPRLRSTLALTIALFFVYGGVQMSAGQWAYASLTYGRGVDRGLAGLLVALFWSGLLLGRVAAAALGHRIRPRRILDVSLSGTLVGGALLAWYPGVVVGGIALFVIGLALAAIFPTLVSLTPARMGARLAPIAIGYQLAGSAVGATVLPALAGIALQEVGVIYLGLLLVGGTVVMVGLHTAIARGPLRDERSSGADERAILGS